MAATPAPHLRADPLVLVDVGCRWGVPPEWTSEDVQVFAFDADPEECRRLQATAPPNVTYVPHALAAADATRPLHVAVEPACSSLFPPDPDAVSTFPELRVLAPARRTDIEVRTLDSWAGGAGIDHVDVLKLDVQGAELEVLQGAERLLPTVRVIEAEVSLNPMYLGQPLFGDVDAFLRSRGFRLWRLGHLVHYSSPEHRPVAGRRDRQFFDGRLVEFQSGPGQLTWGHAYFCAEAMVHPQRRPAAERVRDAAAAVLLGLEELAGHEPARPPREVALSADEARRVALTTAARDTDDIPKVPGAGGIVERDGVAAQVMHNGVLVEEGCYHGAWMTEVIHRLRGHHEPQEERAFHEVVERLREDTPTPTMVELGSFWAYYSLWLKRAIPAARCILVEPDPGSLAVGLRNVALNGVEAESVAAAVGLPDSGTIELLCESDGVTRTVPLVSVDGLMRRLAIPRLDLLLCDTQGAEVDALRGAATALRERTLRFLVISTHHHAISGDPLTHERCLEALAEHGAHIVVEHTVQESASGDGLIVASTDARDADFRIDVSRSRARDTLFGPLDHDLAATLEELRVARRELAAAYAAARPEPPQVA
jgi:FkbM family methyltransferase